jgi:hypothetical protein
VKGKDFCNAIMAQPGGGSYICKAWEGEQERWKDSRNSLIICVHLLLQRLSMFGEGMERWKGEPGA